jgi:hypothetical protein
LRPSLPGNFTAAAAHQQHHQRRACGNPDDRLHHCAAHSLSPFFIGANRPTLNEVPAYPVVCPDYEARGAPHYREALRFLRRIINITSAAPAAIQMIACNIVLLIVWYLLS